MKKYELVFILNNRKISDNEEGYDSRISKVLKKYGANLVSKEELGRKRFARPIGKIKSGSYWSYIVEMKEECVSEFQSEFVLNEVVIRLVAFKYDMPQKLQTYQLNH